MPSGPCARPPGPGRATAPRCRSTERTQRPARNLPGSTWRDVFGPAPVSSAPDVAGRRIESLEDRAQLEQVENIGVNGDGAAEPGAGEAASAGCQLEQDVARH